VHHIYRRPLTIFKIFGKKEAKLAAVVEVGPKAIVIRYYRSFQNIDGYAENIEYICCYQIIQFEQKQGYKSK